MMVLRLAFKTLQLSLIRVGIGWMFALLTFNFNRVTIADLGAMALVVTTLIGLHHFLAPFQVVWGRLADRHPILGYRRTPYILLSALVGSLVFMTLPSLSVALAEGSFWAVLLAFGLFTVFGLAMAANGSATFALIAEVTTARERGLVVAVTQTFLIVSAIVSAGIAKVLMPEYSPEQMQLLYALTPFIALGTSLLGVIGLERRISREQHTALLEQPAVEASQEHSFAVMLRLMSSNRQVWGFFAFVLLAIMGVFLQDTILEPFGALVFDMSVEETTSFTQTWGGGVLLGMLLIGVLTGLLPLSRKAIATIGGLGTALGLALLALAAVTLQQPLITPALLLMGFSVGLFNVGAMSMMMEMTVEGYTGLYMGIWGMAQGLGNGFANVFSGALQTLLIETRLMTPAAGYGFIFTLEVLLMLLALVVLRGISVQEFKALDYDDLTTTMALDTA